MKLKLVIIKKTPDEKNSASLENDQIEIRARIEADNNQNNFICSRSQVVEYPAEDMTVENIWVWVSLFNNKRDTEYDVSIANDD